jgi:DNA repair protein RecN (Recombination protein N)
MIEYLSIKNFALVEELNIHFSAGFNILTGETGAGKSTIIDALSLLLGGRAQAEYIRSGTDKAMVEGVFTLPQDKTVRTLLQELELEGEGNVLILSRELALNGRNICRINGRMLTLGQYRLIGLALVDIHGQHDHQALLQADKHRQFLDQFGGAEHLQLLEEVRMLYERCQMTKKELEALRASEQERLQKIDFLTYQREEIKQVQIQKGELEELTKEVNVLANAGKISENLGQAHERLFGGERGHSAYDLTGKALAGLQEIKHLDPFLEKLAEQLEPALYILEDSALQIRNYLDGLEYSPQKLEESEKRLHLLQDLCKKYGGDLEAVLAYGDTVAQELENWLGSEEREEELVRRYQEEKAAYQLKAELLSKSRQDLGQQLEAEVMQQLVDLAMPNVRFAVHFLPQQAASYGLEQVEFFISPNPGEPLLPVVKIASGGELSRIMLALKTILAQSDGIGTLVFDEIDAGIGGKAAQKVAEKLAEISLSQQVLCVTHAPLIAAVADTHLVLLKEVMNGRTSIRMHELREQERIDELARMLGGENPTTDLKNYAQKILQGKTKKDNK